MGDANHKSHNCCDWLGRTIVWEQHSPYIHTVTPTFLECGEGTIVCKLNSSRLSRKKEEERMGRQWERKHQHCVVLLLALLFFSVGKVEKCMQNFVSGFCERLKSWSKKRFQSHVGCMWTNLLFDCQAKMASISHKNDKIPPIVRTH